MPEPPARPPVATGGAADVEEPSAPCGAPSVAGTAIHSSGVLTNIPALTFAKESGDLTITTAYVKFQQLSSFNSVQVWGDLKNTGTKQLCIPLNKKFQIGTQDLIIVVDGPAYKGSLSNSNACIEPGATGVFSGIQNDVSDTLLDGRPTVTYAFNGYASIPAAALDPNDPQVISATVKKASFGWAVGGQMQAGPSDIYNFGMKVFVRDPNGLIYNDVGAYPNDLGNILAHTSFDFETNPNVDEFCAYERYDKFILGTSSFSKDNADRAETDASREDTARRAAMDAAKDILAKHKRQPQ